MKTLVTSLSTAAARSIICCVFSAVVICLGAIQVDAAPLDFDHDGISDPTWVVLDSQGRLAWRARPSSANFTERLDTMGRDGDALALAHWSGNLIPEIGIVSADPITGNLSWSVAGTPASVMFGHSGDTVISGGNFDREIPADAAIVSKASNRLKWEIRHNLFGPDSASHTTTTQRFGLVGDTVFFANIDGTGDWMALLHPTKDGRGQLQFRNPRTGAVRTGRISARLLANGRPLAVTRADETDLLVFVRRHDSRTELTTVNKRGTITARTILPTAGAAVVGEFNPSAPGQEVAVISSSGSLSFNPVTGAIRSVPNNVGRPLDEINISAFYETNGPTLPGCQQRRAPDGLGGFAWKPNSDISFFALATMPGKLFKKISKVEIYSTKREFIKPLVFDGCGNPEKNGSPRCNYKDPVLTGAQLAQQVGAIFLKVSYSAGGCGSFYVPDPSRQLD